MSTPRRGQVRIAYSSSFATQSDFTTALANNALDAVFNLTDEAPRFEIVTKDDQIKDCTGQYVIDEIVLARACKLSFSIEVGIAQLWGLIKWAFGVVADDEATMLGPTSFQPPVTTFIYGHDGGAVSPLKLKSMVLNTLRITGRVGTRLTASVEFIGSGNIAAAGGGYSFPDCDAITPVYLKDGTFTLNSVSRYADLRSFDFSYSNQLIDDDDPFTLASIDITRLERDDVREYGLTMVLLGEPNDTTHQGALNKSKWPFSLRIGAADDCVTIDAASAIIKQASPPGYDGRANRSVLNLLAAPIRVVENADTPLIATRTEPA